MREGHKALIFSQTTQMLDLIESAVAALIKNEKVERKGISYLRLDGATPIHRRHTIIKHFQMNKVSRVCELSSHPWRSGNVSVQ